MKDIGGDCKIWGESAQEILKKVTKRRESSQKMETSDKAKKERIILLSIAFVFIILYSSNLYALLIKQSQIKAYF